MAIRSKGYVDIMILFYWQTVALSEGLRTLEEERHESVLARMRVYNEHSTWNFENKMLLLEAERMYVLGHLDHAEYFYTQSILSAHKHKFIHEEAIASDLLGEFLYERGIVEKSKSVLLHSIKCYKKWGAFAVARRVEASIQSKFSSDWGQHVGCSDLFTSVVEPDAIFSRKRQNQD
eukprot:CAMPEP_0183753736 /NCGR_PEP_ID=MMETSP0739-20130205/3132_1 /TAXON_ID=385413 /ORGANISM="Thalassiosira miniscula, Strain CCMP1093" /LENGTH=176 /DNA_ID=CAMNT_0025990281 /DNA_START=423 /DNA_END=953 /DNA_ORIENTATION=-